MLGCSNAQLVKCSNIQMLTCTLLFACSNVHHNCLSGCGGNIVILQQGSVVGKKGGEVWKCFSQKVFRGLYERGWQPNKHQAKGTSSTAKAWPDQINMGSLYVPILDGLLSSRFTIICSTEMIYFSNTLLVSQSSFGHQIRTFLQQLTQNHLMITLTVQEVNSSKQAKHEKATPSSIFIEMHSRHHTYLDS